MSLVPLGAVDGRTAWTVEAPDRTLAVFVVADGLRVTDADCPHNGGPLIEGEVADGCVVCPWHCYRFDLTSGVCRTSDRFALGVYAASQRDGLWYADVPARPPARPWSALRRTVRNQG